MLQQLCLKLMLNLYHVNCLLLINNVALYFLQCFMHEYFIHEYKLELLFKCLGHIRVPLFIN